MQFHNQPRVTSIHFAASFPRAPLLPAAPVVLQLHAHLYQLPDLAETAALGKGMGCENECEMNYIFFFQLNHVPSLTEQPHRSQFHHKMTKRL